MFKAKRYENSNENNNMKLICIGNLSSGNGNFNYMNGCVLIRYNDDTNNNNEYNY